MMSDSTIKFGYSGQGRLLRDQPISYLMSEALSNPRLISLAAGFVDYQTLPVSELSELMCELCGNVESGRSGLQYGTTQGLPGLRQLAFEHLAELDGLTSEQMPGGPGQMVISTGSQQMLHLLAELLLDPGDIVITAWPSYFVFTSALAGFGVSIRGIDMDDGGLVPQKLESLLAAFDAAGQLGKVKIVYICSYHQNPTGLTLSEDRRSALFDIVKRYSKRHKILLIEDAAYRQLTYEDDRPGSIKRFDTSNEYVAMLSTFSKPFAPGLKTGCTLLPGDLVEKVIFAKGGHDFGSANLCQHLLERAMSKGIYQRHVEALCQSYAIKRDAMLESLEAKFGDTNDIHWTYPTGGLYVWLTLPKHINTSRDGVLFKKAIEEGVLYVPGEYCYPNDPTREPPRNTIRLSYGVPTVEQIHEGVERLARTVNLHY